MKRSEYLKQLEAQYLATLNGNGNTDTDTDSDGCSDMMQMYLQFVDIAQLDTECSYLYY